jgi:uncharacterized protein (DUF697 family)
MSDLDLPEPVPARERAESTVRKAVLAATGAGGVAGALPVPFVDVAVAAPIQVAMINAISAHYGLPTVERQATLSVSLVASAVTAQVSRHTAKAATRAALKLVAKKAARLVPVVGPLVGGVISAAVAGTTTAALGAAWIKVCEYANENDLKKLDEFLESTEGQVLLTFIAACGLSALLYTLATTAEHKVVPTAAGLAATGKLSREEAAERIEQLENALDNAKFDGDLALAKAARRAELAEEAHEKLSTMVEEVLKAVRRQRNRTEAIENAEATARIALTSQGIETGGLGDLLKGFVSAVVENEQLDRSVDYLIDTGGGRKVFRAILDNLLRREGLVEPVDEYWRLVDGD